MMRFFNRALVAESAQMDSIWGKIVGVLKQAEVGMPVAELIRKVGISEQTFYRWKKQYVGLEVDQVLQMK